MNGFMCDWNPVENRPLRQYGDAKETPHAGAEYIVGTRHSTIAYYCAACASLRRFNRHAKARLREPLRGKP